MSIFRTRFTAIALLGTCVFASLQAADEPFIPATAQLFSYLKNKTDHDGLFLAWSADGLTWRELNYGQTLFIPTVGEEKRMRDPYLMQAPDGIWHLVWATGWRGQTFGYASSADLVHWSSQREIPAMHDIPAACNVWTPKISYDEKNREFLVYWASAVPGRLSAAEPATDSATDKAFKLENHQRIYASRTKDFTTFTPPVIFFDPGYATVDATIQPANGRFHMFYLGDKPVADTITQHIFHATADTLAGPYREQGEALPTAHIQGPSITPSPTGGYLLYFDLFGENRYGLAKSNDLLQWTDTTTELAMPRGANRGRILPVPGTVVRQVLQLEQAQRAAAPRPVLEGLNADPSIRVFGDKYYLYPTADKPNWKTTDFSAWSSPDLITWTKECMVLDVTKDLAWANIEAWAPDAIARDGHYFFYFCAQKQIGVATGDSPAGPFHDALGKPLLIHGGKVNTNQCLDPYPFIDDDGQAYLYFGSGRVANVVRLKPDMVTIDGDPMEVSMPEFNEGIVVFKRRGLYYFMWSIDDARSENYRVAYGTAHSPLGPIECTQNALVLRKSGPVKGTGHHSVLNIPGTDRWYVAYHRHGLPNGNGYQRETCLARMEFTAEGAIKPMDPLVPAFAPGALGEPLSNGRGTPDP